MYLVLFPDPYGCQDDDFHCKNNRCIDKSLKCDGYDHCGDNSDETKGCSKFTEGFEPKLTATSRGRLHIGFSVTNSLVVPAAPVYDDDCIQAS